MDSGWIQKRERQKRRLTKGNRERKQKYDEGGK